VTRRLVVCETEISMSRKKTTQGKQKFSARAVERKAVAQA
jgi:hypothetical protein